MDDKERLEKIKDHWYVPPADSFVSRVDVDWLIEQAERVKKLENDIENYKKACKSWEVVNDYDRKQNKRYREALKYYADERKYFEQNHGSIVYPDYRTEIEDECGELARKALEGTK